VREAAHLTPPGGAGIRRQRIHARLASSFLPKLTRKAFERYGFATPALITDWPAIAGARLAALSQPERLKWPRKAANVEEIDETSRNRPGATLVLRVHPAVALEIEYAAADVMGRVNSYLGYRAVARIQVVQDPNLSRDRANSAAADLKPEAEPASTANSGYAEQSKSSTKTGLEDALSRLEANILSGRSG